MAVDGGAIRVEGMPMREMAKFMPPSRAAEVMPTVWRSRMGAMLGVREVMVAPGSIEAGILAYVIENTREDGQRK